MTASGDTVTALDRVSVGIIPPFGGCYPRRLILFHPFQHGQASSQDACTIDSHWMKSWNAKARYLNRRIDVVLLKIHLRVELPLAFCRPAAVGPMSIIIGTWVAKKLSASQDVSHQVPVEKPERPIIDPAFSARCRTLRNRSLTAHSLCWSRSTWLVL